MLNRDEFKADRGLLLFVAGVKRLSFWQARLEYSLFWSVFAIRQWLAAE
jgi:hypothetical protein